MATKRRKKRLRFKKNAGRFILLVTILLAIVGGMILFLKLTSKKGEIQLGSVSCEVAVTAAVVRDEKVILTEPYEKIAFNVVEGQTVNNGDLIAQVYKRGYQEETMVSLLSLQKQIFAYQKQLLGGNIPSSIVDINANIDTVESQIRSVSRGDSSLDMLDLEQQLKSLQSERIAAMKNAVSPDGTLQGMYTELDAQESLQDTWKRDIRNEVGAGVISFYFDGYEQVLNVSKLSTINGALVNSVVKGGNTANTSTSTSDTPLYRIMNNTHWYLMFVQKASEPFRLVSDEMYDITVTDILENSMQAYARDTIVSENYTVNKLEFNTDIGKLSGVRTVPIVVQKRVEGLVVPLEALQIVSGVPGLNVEIGNEVLRVEVEVLATDEKRACIRPANDQDTLVAGQKYIKQ